MSDKLTVETVEKTIERLKKVPTEVQRFTCACCGKENDTPYVFLSIHRQRLICEDCYRQECVLMQKVALGLEKSWSLYRYRCTGDRKWMKGADNDS